MLGHPLEKMLFQKMKKKKREEKQRSRLQVRFIKVGFVIRRL